MKSILEPVKRSTAGVCFIIPLNQPNPELISNASARISLLVEQKDKNLKKSIASSSVVLKKARSQLLSVHEMDIKHWALKKTKEINDTAFVATDFWLHQFERRHHICGRKITKLVTKRQVVNEEDIRQSADQFVMQVQKSYQNTIWTMFLILISRIFHWSYSPIEH